MIDLKQTKKEGLKSEGIPVSTGKYEPPKYPWGLEINLENGSLEKLNLSANKFTVGKKVRLVCEAEVIGVSQNQRLGNEKSESVRLQIQKMDISMKEKPALDWDTPAEKAETELHRRGVIK